MLWLFKLKIFNKKLVLNVILLFLFQHKIENIIFSYRSNLYNVCQKKRKWG